MPRLLATTRLLAQLAGDDFHAGSPRQHASRLVRLGLLIGVCCLAAFAASAAEAPRPAEPLFHVEILIVRPTTPLGVPEDWSIESAAAQPPAAAEPDEEPETEEAAPPAERLAVQTMAPGQLRLSGLAASLGRSSDYEVLRHLGWTQPATPRGEGLAVQIEDLAGGGQPLRGTVALERGRYLHLRLDLAYSPDVPPNSLLGQTSQAGPVTFSLRQSRRVRSFERHYFDHPAFGVIAMVSPVGASPRGNSR